MLRILITVTEMKPGQGGHDISANVTQVQFPDSALG